MVHKVLILGSGLVVKPGVQYLAEKGFVVTLATRTLEKAKNVISQSKKDTKVKTELKIIPTVCDVTKDAETLDKLVKENDFIVSLLPYIYHVQVAKVAIKYKKNFFTTSYVSDAMRALEEDAKKAGIIMVNECGVDPGTDHMSAMRTIHKVRKDGGKITSFLSFCGGLPAPDCNDNPFGYKLSWAPRGVLLASKNTAEFLKDGKDVTIDGKVLFDNFHVEEVGDLGKFEGYPNRNSKSYIDVYGIKDTKTIIRGTFRNLGWCQSVKKISDLGYLSLDENKNLSEKTFLEILQKNILNTEEKDLKKLKELVAKKVGLKSDDKIISNIEWLGLFSGSEKTPKGTTTLLDALCFLCQNKLVYKEGERDMLVMQHKYTAEYKDRTEYLTTTLTDFGIKNGDTSMSRTVSLPVAIAVTLVADGKLKLTGCQIPIIPELYHPILDELEALGITFVDKTVKVVKK